MNPSLHLIGLLADSYIPPGRTPAGRCIRSSVLKSVLFVVIYFEGHPISNRALSERAGCDQSTVACALHVLRKYGIISTRSPPRRKGQTSLDYAHVYRVSAPALTRFLLSDTPLAMKPRGRSPSCDPLSKSETV